MRPRVLLAIALSLPHAAFGQTAPLRADTGRFTAVFYPTESTLAHALLGDAMLNDSFPGLPRPTEHVLIAIAPDKRHFREWVGPSAPEWGAAITFPDSRRVVMQGRSAGADAGDPRGVLRHELAHLALHEYLGDLPPRWFDEGYASYAAREWGREDVLEANLALAFAGAPTFDELDEDLDAGASRARDAYALSYRAVADLAELDTARGLRRLFENWKAKGDLDQAMRETYGVTLVEWQHRWQRHTRRRYGALALVTDVAFGGFLLLIIIVPLYVLRRKRDRRRMAALVAADEAAERAMRRSVIEALLRGDDESGLSDETSTTPRP